MSYDEMETLLKVLYAAVTVLVCIVCTGVAIYLW